MDSQSLSLLIAAASLITGILFCWLLMRGRIAAAAAQGKSEVQTELSLAKERVRSLDDDRQLAVANYEALKGQAAQWREALDLARNEQAQLAERASRVATLEAKLLTLQEQEKASQQEFLRLSASDADNTQSLKLVAARLVEAEDENAALKRDVAAISSKREEPNARPATPEAEVTQLPVLETEVLALQSLAKTIQQEFLVLLDVQRNFTAASSALQDVS